MINPAEAATIGTAIASALTAVHRAVGLIAVIDTGNQMSPTIPTLTVEYSSSDGPAVTPGNRVNTGQAGQIPGVTGQPLDVTGDTTRESAGPITTHNSGNAGNGEAASGNAGNGNGNN